MDTETQGFKLEKPDIKVRTDQCAHCLISFGTKKKMSAMVRVTDAEGTKLVCEACWREGEKKGTLTKVKKLSKKEKKALKRQRKKQPKIVRVIRKRK